MSRSGKIEEMIKSGELEIDLANETNEAVKNHIADCAECRDFIESMKKISSVIRNSEKITVSDSFSQGLKIKLEAAKKEEQKNIQPSIPLFTRMVYYVSGAAAMIIGFMYISSLGVFDQKTDNNIIPSVPGTTQLAAAEKEDEKSLTDSLETLRDNVVNDEEMRLRVNAEER
jgi:predicted anti-sigma-YlaC factor YlaD